MSESVQTGGKVLVVDDDMIGLKLTRALLRRLGYEVHTAGNVAAAREVLEKEIPATFVAVVSDYWMPNENGIDLLRWIKTVDPHLATVIMTAAGEKNLVAELLREGACHYLDKPIQEATLSEAVSKAISLTLAGRRLDETAKAAKDLGSAQTFLLSQGFASEAGVETRYYPQHEAGGDSLNFFPKGDQRYMLLAGDVSGHNLKAAFTSAYFQGAVRAMFEAGKSVVDTFDYFNGILYREWNTEEDLLTPVISVSGCAAEVDLANKKVSVTLAGFPRPIVSCFSGRIRYVGEERTAPLGWMENLDSEVREEHAQAGGLLYLWTDGLEDVADLAGVNVLAVAEQLLDEEQGAERPSVIADAADDVLIVRARLTDQKVDLNECFLPVFYAEYYEHMRADIDAFQQAWERSLRMALPELSDERVFDILLCSREAVINALKYGCASAPDAPCHFQVSYQWKSSVVRVLIEDPGEGHAFDVEAHEKEDMSELVDLHRGLMLMTKMTKRLERRRNGATVEMDFSIS